jgi:hypothetical protein
VRTLQVDQARLTRWCQGFADRHGGAPLVARDGEALRLTAPDGAVAVLSCGFPVPGDVVEGSGPDGWIEAAGRRRRCAVLLIRRGGYACARVDTGLTGAAAVTASKVGTRYVQSRTAAGGWSQQRFARRREGQARELVGAAVEVAARLLLPADAGTWLVTGGDRPLADAALADPRLAALGRLPRGPHLTVGDPRSDVVRSVPDLLRAVRIQLTEPAPA